MLGPEHVYSTFSLINSKIKKLSALMLKKKKNFLRYSNLIRMGNDQLILHMFKCLQELIFSLL